MCVGVCNVFVLMCVLMIVDECWWALMKVGVFVVLVCVLECVFWCVWVDVCVLLCEGRFLMYVDVCVGLYVIVGFRVDVHISVAVCE